MSFYADMALVVSDLLKPDEDGGLGATAGAITLTRWTLTPAADPWGDPSEASQTETLKAIVTGVSSEFVGLPAAEPANGVVLASDTVCVCSVPALTPEPGDIVSVDDTPTTVVRVDRIPSAGTPVAFRLFLRGGGV